MSSAVPVLEMCLDVLYFHSCGIVGIMMVVIKLAHLCAVLLCLFIVYFYFFLKIVCWMWAVGFVCFLILRRWRRDWTQKALSSPFIPIRWMFVQGRKKKKEIWKQHQARSTTLHATVHTMWKKRNFCRCLKTLLPVVACRRGGIVGDHTWRVKHVAHTHIWTLCDHGLPLESTSVNGLHGNAVAAADRRGVSRLCSAVKKKKEKRRRRRKKNTKPSARTNQCATKWDLR